MGTLSPCSGFNFHFLLLTDRDNSPCKGLYHAVYDVSASLNTYHSLLIILWFNSRMFVIKVYGFASEDNPVYEMHGCVHAHACIHVFLESCVACHTYCWHVLGEIFFDYMNKNAGRVKIHWCKLTMHVAHMSQSLLA